MPSSRSRHRPKLNLAGSTIIIIIVITLIHALASFITAMWISAMVGAVAVRPVGSPAKITIRQSLNSAAHYFTGEDSFKLESNFTLIVNVIDIKPFILSSSNIDFIHFHATSTRLHFSIKTIENW